MTNKQTNTVPNTEREYISYRPRVVSRMSGAVVVYLYTDNAQPDAWMDAFMYGRRFRDYVPATTAAAMLELRTEAGAEIGQNSTFADVREAFERAVEYLGWTSSVNGTSSRSEY